MNKNTITVVGFKDAFRVLDGFHFAAEKDRSNALMLLNWMHELSKNPSRNKLPAVIISGPPGSGKTEMLRRFVEAAGLPPEMTFTKVERWCFDQAAPLKARVLGFDLGGDGRLIKQAIDSSFLHIWVGSAHWAVRRTGMVTEEQFGISCVPVLMTSASRGLETAGDDFLHIRLKARKEEAETTAEGEG